MRSILVTGGAGEIGYNFLEKLIATNYNVTVLDLESKVSVKRLSNFKNIVKIVYGDIEDANLVRDLVRRNDIVIDFAGVMPPLTNLNEGLANSTNFGGTKNIVDAICELNPECVYIYLSFISVYGNTDTTKRKLDVKTESNHPDDFYSISLERSESYIREKLKDYTIIRMPIVLTSKNYFLEHMRLDTRMDFISKEDLNNVIVKIIESKKYLGKTFNISGFVANSSDIVRKLYHFSGDMRIMNRNLYYGIYEDGDKILSLTGIKPSDKNDVLDGIAYQVNPFKRKIRKIVNFPKYLIFKCSCKKK